MAEDGGCIVARAGPAVSLLDAVERGGKGMGAAKGFGLARRPGADARAEQQQQQQQRRLAGAEEESGGENRCPLASPRWSVRHARGPRTPKRRGP